ncbi:DUF4767 domain-containing protein [uncultured Lactobacillus sp.]|uniref:DUF4767 domain-containing protein n=1 Tax=uncultured Lactobacillus sp. TaxID=153152 RepID=UPI0026342660|nr:DUF4767 domain-containing protein [uncultured Lactobacillus sp.]
MKKIILLLALVFCLGFTGCQNQKKNTNTQSQQETKILNSKKQSQLSQTMKKYGQKQNVKYHEYNGVQELRITNGRVYPDIFKTDTFYLNNKKISIGWDPYGKHHYDYEVLAIYNADLSKNNHKTFLFCRHDKKPIILVENDNSNSDKVILKQSPDKGLNSAFVGIMNGFNK